jgi:hypothetical protein
LLKGDPGGFVWAAIGIAKSLFQNSLVFSHASFYHKSRGIAPGQMYKALQAIPVNRLTEIIS